MKFDFDDIVIVPETISSINSRSEVNPFDENGMLPIMTAPMDTVVDYNNFKCFVDNKINVVMPRMNSKTFHSSNKIIFHSFGLNDFKEIYIDKVVINPDNGPIYVLIDIANGNMSNLFSIANEAKNKYGNELVLMIGNVANPKTFEEWCKVGVDYVRCGIGNGNGCLTTANVGVGYPMGSLINECFKIKQKNNYKTKIVADGGFKNYSDINKALALGADYVMLGSMLNKCYEAAGEIYTPYMCGNWDNFTKEWWEENEKRLHKKPSKFPQWLTEYFLMDEEEQKKYLVNNNDNLYKKFRGMSTKEVQRDWGREELKTSEGISKYNKVEYTIKGFTENLTDYLRSAMSYTNSLTLDEFKGSQFELISENAFKRFNK
jgi:IMP dehydrogenase/GMP reductase